MEEVLHAVVDTYRDALRSTAHYAVELDSIDTTEFREHIERLLQEVEHAIATEDWKGVQASLRGELRDFRDKTAGRVGRLRSEIQEATAAVHSFAETVASIDSDHTGRIKEALSTLDGIS